jgi:hypothetical protein
MTVDDVLRFSATGLLTRMHRAGFDYIAFGMETVNEAVAARMSKHRKVKGLWTEANRLALAALHHANMRAGVFVLWGLRETQMERENQLAQLAQWREVYGGQPCAIGLNWATLHPSGKPNEVAGKWHWEAAREDDLEHRPLPDFLDWGTAADSARLRAFVELFGEATEQYPYYYGEIPQQGDLDRLRKLFHSHFD